MTLGIPAAAAAQSSAECAETTVVAPVTADAWVDLNSPTANKGSDAVLDVSGESRGVLQFSMPAAVPAGCVIATARLRVYADSGTEGTRVHAFSLASGFVESTVNWDNQPDVVGTPASAWSRDGYMAWNVTPQVQAMLDGGAGRGFSLRDSAEGTEFAGGHGFYSREKGENPPELVIRFARPPSGEPAPPEPAVAAAVTCGQTITRSTLVTNDLTECLGDGLVIGAPRIVVDLGGHVIDGVGLGTGIRNEGYGSVTVRNGTVQEFDYGVQLFEETESNTVAGLTVHHNEVAAVELFDAADGNEVRGNTFSDNGGGILLVSGTTGTVVADNTLTLNSGGALVVRDSDGNRLEGNRVVGGGDLGIGLERSGGNVVLDNVVSDTSDGGVMVTTGSHGNRIEGNDISNAGDTGIMIMESDRNEIVSNVAHGMSDAGITLHTASDGAVRFNDVGGNPGGLQIDGSSRNLIEGNDASLGSGIGIELGGGSFGNTLLRNVANGNGSQGIYIGDEAILLDPGNVLDSNTANANGNDGITVAKGGHTLLGNVARDNRAWGINAAILNIDGGRNAASGNAQPPQCIGVACKAEWIPPETTITEHPPPATRSTSAIFRFEGDDDTSAPSALQFECRLGDAAFASCVSPRVYSGLSTGTYVFEVRATDAAGNVEDTPARFEWSIDSTPPETVIDAGPPELTREGSARFEFSASEPGATFECSLDGAPFAGCASPAMFDGLATGDHTFRVRATDAAGNTDQTPAAYSWAIDVTPPETTIDAGPQDPTNSTSARFEFSSDEAGSTFECSLDGGEFGPCGTYDDLAEGRHTFQVRATDQAGNTDATPAAYSWTVDVTAPEASIDSAPANPTNRTAASFEFSADEPGSTFECSLDGAEFSSCGTYDDLAEGRHTFQVRATDQAGNTDATPASHSWTIDVTAPETTIDAGPTDPTNRTSASFEFSSNEAGSTFECSLDGAEFGSCGAYEELAEGEHTFRVRATDRAGNTDPTPAAHSWTIDVTAPETTIDAGPADPTKSTSASFEFSSDEAGSTFECALDSADFGPCGEYHDLTDGRHTFQVRATDRAGNTDPTPASYSWTVDTMAPETTIDNAPADPTKSTSARFEFSSDEAGSTFACSLDGADFGPCGPYDDLTEGEHTFRVRATDRAGNTDTTPATRSWTIDVTAPETTINAGPADPTNRTSARFEFSSNEAGSGFECSLDGAAFTACASPAEYTSLPGTHTFLVRATDRAGNTDATPASHSWTIDVTAPQTTIDNAPADPTKSTSARFEFSSDEPGSTFECSLDGAEFASCGPYDDLAEGEHTFRVRATDRAGNTDATPAAHTWTIDATAPETTIDAGPAALTRSADATFEFSSNEAGSTFECSLDGAEFAPCSSPRDYPGLSDGSHAFRVRATDRAGNADASAASRTWTVDTVAPETSIDGGPEDPTESTSASFDLSSDEAGSSFECSLDGAAFEPCASPREYEDLAVGTHTFRVRATDRAGNVDATPAVRTWTIEDPDTTPPDTTAPQTAIDSAPADPSNSTSASFEFSADEAGSSFECSLDNAAFAACVSPRQYTSLSAGSHTFRVRATDRAGNTDQTPAAHSWTIDTTAPQTTIATGPPALTTSTSASVTFTSSETGSTFECSLDNAAYAACTSPQQYAGLSDGSHTVRVRAIDRAGNTDATPATRTWTVDTTAPQTTIGQAPAVQSPTTAATFTFTSSETGSTFECSLDNAAFVACTSPRQHNNLSAGTHNFRVRARDTAGNVDATPATHTWTIDTTAPNTTLGAGSPPAQTPSTSATFTFTSNESAATFECSLDNAAFAACTSPRQLTGLAPGSHNFRVRARDGAGNVDASPATHNWTITAPQGCTTTTLTATADAWIDQNSPTSNKGSDSILKVQSKGASDNFRAVVRFTLPASLPQGCTFSSATLRLFAASSKPNRTLNALRLTSTWTENLVNWNNQPATAGAAATTASGTGYREWNVTDQVQAMLAPGANHGFLIRDAVEGADSEQQFHSREKGQNPPQLVIRFTGAS